MSNTRKWAQAAFTRAARTMAQVALGMLPAAAMVTEVDWVAVALTALTAGVASLIMSVVRLPEAVGESSSFIGATFWRQLCRENVRNDRYIIFRNDNQANK